MPELSLNPAPVYLIFILEKRDYVMLESCTLSALKMGVIVFLCVTKVPEMYTFLGHKIANITGTSSPVTVFLQIWSFIHII